jgi:competence protein ComEC
MPVADAGARADYTLVQRILPLTHGRAVLSTWADAEQGRFVLFLPACLAAGVVAYFGWPREPSSILAALMAAILLASGVAARSRPLLRAAMICIGLAACGFACARHAALQCPRWAVLPRHAAIVSGRVGAIDILPEGWRVRLEDVSLDGGPALPRALRIRLRAGDRLVPAEGDRISVRALVRPPSPPAYPGGWDMQRDAFFTGLGGAGFAIGPAARLGSAAPAQAGLRSTVARRIMAALPGSQGAIAATLLSGMGTAIPPEDRAAFQDSGLAHLLAVAGLHAGIVMGLAYGACRWTLRLSEHALLFWPVRQIAGVAALLAGFGYLVLTGGHVPMLRSFTMACLVTLALLTGRRAASLRGLAVAASVLMLAAPQLVMGVSFQMSFAAVLALIAGWEALAPRLATAGSGTRAILAVAVTSALAGTASLPVAAYHFGKAALYYVPANMVAVPLAAFWVMPWGLAALALMPLGLERLALVPMGWGIALLLRVAHAVAGWPYASLAVPQMPAASLLLMMAGLVWLCVWRTKLRLGGLGLMAAGLAVMAAWPLPSLMVGPGARVIAARIGGQVYVSAASGASRFDREAPGRLWGMTTTGLFPGAGTAAGGALRCDRLACRWRAQEGEVVLARDAAAACRGAAVWLAHDAPPVDAGACTAAIVLDRDSAARHGAATVRLGGPPPKLRTDAAERGQRPWFIAPQEGVAAPALVPAMTE